VWEADVYLLIQLSDEFNYVPNNSERCLEYGQVSYLTWELERERESEDKKLEKGFRRI
jgi:hypothetical protein